MGNEKAAKKKAGESGDNHKAAPAGDATTKALVPEGTKAVTSFDFGANAGLGMETVPDTLRKIPFLLLVNSLTPGVNEKGHPLFGQVGNFYNPLTGRVYDGERGFVGVALAMNEEYVERTTDKDRKFVGKHKPGSEVVALGKKRTDAMHAKEPDDPKYKFGKCLAPSGPNVLIQTYGLLSVLAPVGLNGEPEYEEAFGAVVPFKSTGIPGLSTWTNGIATNRTLPDGTRVPPGHIPMCANEFKLTAKFKQDGPNAWYLPLIATRNADVVSSIAMGPLYDEAIKQHTDIKAGKAAVDESAMDAATGGGEAGTPGAPGVMDF